jgi:DNA-directed RNA polymerase subunit P
MGKEIKPNKPIAYEGRKRKMSGDNPESHTKVFGGVVYECVRCGTKVNADELAQLPEIKCICGYRVLKKARPPVVKQVKSI